MPDRTQQANGVPSPSLSNDEEFPENQNTTRIISQSTQTTQTTETARPGVEPNGQINGDHITTTTNDLEEEEQWHPIPITLLPPPTPRLPSISRFPNLSTIITQIGPQILIEEALPIPDENSPTLGLQDPFHLVQNTLIETENDQPPAIPPRSLRRPRRRSPSSESEPVMGGRRENRVEYIGAQGLDRVNQVPRPPPGLISRLRTRDMTIGIQDDDVDRFPMPPSGGVSRLRRRDATLGIQDDDENSGDIGNVGLTRGEMAMRIAREMGRAGEEPNGTSLRPRVSFLRPVGNSLMLDVGDEEDEDEEDGFEDEVEDEEREISDSNPVEEEEDQELPEEQEDYNFTPKRRRRLTQQMTRDINQYTTRREEEFGREHGYQLYPLYTEPPETPLNRVSTPPPAPNSPEPREVTPTSPPRLRRSAFTSPNLREIITSPNPLTSNSSPFSNPPRPFPIPLRNRGRARRSTRLTPLTASTPDHTQDFSLYLYAIWRSNNPEINILEMEELLARGGISFLPSLPSQPPSIRDLLVYERMADSLQPDILWLIINQAITDGLDQREATEFIGHWNQYVFRFQDPYPEIEGMIPLLHLQFFIALQLGWGSWSPSYNFLRSVRRLFVRESTRFPHIPWDGIPTGPGDPRTSALDWITRMRSIPFPERRRMLDLAGEGADIHRVVGIFQTWLMQGRFVENSRMPGETGFSTEELRLDRLERITREEEILNR